MIANAYRIGGVHWRDDKRLWMTFIGRGFQRYALIELNAETGESRTIAEEKDEKFIHMFEKCGWWDLGGGKLLWRSESSGWSQLYIIDIVSGQRRQLTADPGVVRGVEHVSGDEIIYQLSGHKNSEDPYHLHWAT